MALGVGKPVATARVVLRAGTKGCDRGLRDAEQQTSRTGKALGSALKVGAAGAAVGIGAAVVALKSSVAAAQEAEQSQKRMEAQLRASGISYKRHAGEIEQTI